MQKNRLEAMVSMKQTKIQSDIQAQDIDRIVLKSRYPNQTVKSHHVSVNIKNLTFTFLTKRGAEIFSGGHPPS